MKKFIKISLSLVAVLFAVLVGAIVFLTMNKEDFAELSVEVADSAKTVKKKEVVKNDSDVIYTLNGFEEMKTIPDGSGYFENETVAADSTFMVINFTVKNEKKEKANINMESFKLVSNDGTVYAPTTIVFGGSDYLIFDELNPGLTIERSLAFEVPTGLTGLELQIQSNLFKNDVEVIELN